MRVICGVYVSVRNCNIDHENQRKDGLISSDFELLVDLISLYNVIDL